mgnify:CR=1 FL=1|nr:MAG TPA: hypothetical protein [Crassvirales sp.]
MTTLEFSNEFDVLINAYANEGAFGDNYDKNNLAFDEYEKSTFFTKAQEEIIIGLYNGKNPFEDSFEKTEEIKRYLSSLIKTYTTSVKETTYKGLSKHSVFFKLPKDLWFITYEAVDLKDDELGCRSGENISVVPITQDEYHRVGKNPFRGANERRALRLDLDNQVVEIISKYNVESYLVRYLSRPAPIILTNLTDGLSINGISVKTECGLNPVIHRAILERAVKLAIISRVPSAGK